MASLASNTDGEITEFKRRLGAAGFTPDEVRIINEAKGNAIARWLHERLMEHPRFKLVHGVFNKTSDVLMAFKARCVAKGIDFDRLSWIGSEAAPEFDPDDPETVVVLDATLGTLQETIEFAWAWTIDGQKKNWRWPELKTDAKNMRLLSDDREEDAEGDSPEFSPFTLRWTRIKLDTHIGARPRDVRDSATSPGCALLFVSAEHPERIREIDYKRRFGFWLSGLKCSTPLAGLLQSVPYVYFDPVGFAVNLDADAAGYSSGDLAIPSSRE